MSSEKKELEKIRALLPFYVAGSLLESEKREVEEALQNYPELQKELEEWKRIKESYQELQKDIPEPSFQIYEEILRRVKTRPPSRMWIFMRKRAFRSLEIALILIQFLVILFLGMKVYFSPGYYTLSSPPVYKKEKFTINVIFKETATEREIRKLLLSQKARIVDGPYPSGLYVITVNPEKAARALNVFKKSPLVVMAEKAL